MCQSLYGYKMGKFLQYNLVANIWLNPTASFFLSFFLKNLLFPRYIVKHSRTLMEKFQAWNTNMNNYVFLLLKDNTR